jgi:hypothetical protein
MTMASRCATSSGSLLDPLYCMEIHFTVWKESPPDTEYIETFQRIPDLNVISKEILG